MKPKFPLRATDGTTTVDVQLLEVSPGAITAGSGAINIAGNGDVTGPSSAVDGNLAVFDGTTGKLIKDGGAVPGGYLSAVLQSDFTKTNNTLASVTDLTLNLEAGKWYRITGQLTEAGPTSGGTLDFAGGTVTATGVSGNAVGFDDNSGSLLAISIASLGGATLNVSSGDIAYWNFDFTIQVNAGGTLIPRFAQDVTDADPSTLRKYATIQAVDVTPS